MLRLPISGEEGKKDGIVPGLGSDLVRSVMREFVRPTLSVSAKKRMLFPAERRKLPNFALVEARGVEPLS